MKNKFLILAFLITEFLFGQSPKVKFQQWKEVTTTERDAFTPLANTNPQIYNVTTNQFEYWDGDSWEALGGGATTATDGGAFTGALALDNSLSTYYDDYDLATSGTITFTVNVDAKIGTYDTFKIISDGTTEFVSSSNLKNTFRIRNGVPETRILPQGSHFVMIFKSGVDASGNDIIGITINDFFEPSYLDNMPYAGDVVFYIDTQFPDQVTEDVNGVTEMINIADPFNPFINNLGSNQPSYDSVNNTLVLDASNLEVLLMDNVFISTGATTVTFIVEKLSGTSDSLLCLSKPSEGSSAREFCITLKNKNLITDGIYLEGSVNVDSNSARADTIYQNLVMVTISVDSQNGEWNVITRPLIAGDSYERTLSGTVASPIAMPLNRIEMRNGDSVYGVKSIVVHNTILTNAQAKEVQNYLATSVGLTQW